MFRIVFKWELLKKLELRQLDLKKLELRHLDLNLAAPDTATGQIHAAHHSDMPDPEVHGARTDQGAVKFRCKSLMYGVVF